METKEIKLKTVDENDYLSEIEFQVNKPNGDIDFITVYDLPERLAMKFVENKYPNCKVKLYQTIK